MSDAANERFSQEWGKLMRSSAKEEGEKMAVAFRESDMTVEELIRQSVNRLDREGLIPDDSRQLFAQELAALAAAVKEKCVRAVGGRDRERWGDAPKGSVADHSNAAMSAAFLMAVVAIRKL